jgi:hypothetical protein
VKNARYKQGDVLRREFEGGAIGIVRLVYLSKYFKRVVLVALYDESGVAAPSDLLNKAPLAHYYTGLGALMPDQGWEHIGTTPALVGDRLASRRIVGGDVWEEDERLGPARPDDEASLPSMAVYGSAILGEKIADALHGSRRV